MSSCSTTSPPRQTLDVHAVNSYLEAVTLGPRLDGRPAGAQIAESGL
jgi:hypothetical protein